MTSYEQGGHLLGVVDKMDYLQDLGVNLLYLTPVNTSRLANTIFRHGFEKFSLLRARIASQIIHGKRCFRFYCVFMKRLRPH